MACNHVWKGSSSSLQAILKHCPFAIIYVQVPCVQLLSCSHLLQGHVQIFIQIALILNASSFCLLISFSFPLALLLPAPTPASSLLHRGLQPWLRSYQPVTLIYKRETGRQKVTADNHHGISKSTVLRFYSGFVWCFWRHHSHLATKLEGKCRCWFKYHNSYNTDARTLDGLHVVQHWDVQLYPEIFCSLPPRLHPGCTDHHGTVLYPISLWDLHHFSWNEMYKVGRGHRQQKPRLFCWRSLLHSCRNLWISTNILVHERNYFKFSGPDHTREQ